MKIASEIDLTKGNLLRNLLYFTLPFLLGNLFNSFYSAIDLFFIGQFSTTAHMAAVSSGTTIMFAVNSIILGLGTGGTIVIGNLIGAKSKKVGETTKSFVTYMTILTISIMAIMLALSWPVMKWMKLGEESINLGRYYLLILTAGIPFYSIYHSADAILKANGNSKPGFIFLFIAVGINIVLDALFIVGFKWGAVGAAAGTTIGEVVGAIASIIYMKKADISYEMPKGLNVDRFAFRNFAKSGVPIAIQDGLVIISFAIILAFISKRGDSYTAAVGITDRITSFGFAVLSAIGCSVSTAAAQNNGANNIPNIKKYLKIGLLVALIAGVVMTGLNVIFAKQFASLFAGNAASDARDIARLYIMSTSIDLFVCAFVFPLNAIFLGTGHSVFSMVQNLATTFVFRLPIAFIFAKTNQPMFVIGFAYPLSTIFSLTLCLIFYYRRRWEKHN